MHSDSTNTTTPKRPKNTQPGESHDHHMGDVNSVEVLDGKLVVESNCYRRTFELETTFCEVQRIFYEDFRVWLRADCRDGEKHQTWWDRVTADAALFSQRGAA